MQRRTLGLRPEPEIASTLLEAKLVGVETVDHPSDPQLAAYARSFFATSTSAAPAVLSTKAAEP